MLCLYGKFDLKHIFPPKKLFLFGFLIVFSHKFGVGEESDLTQVKSDFRWYNLKPVLTPFNQNGEIPKSVFPNEIV